MKKSFAATDLSSAKEITCTYPQTVYANYFKSDITHELPKPEKDPFIFTFSELNNKDSGKLSYIDATRTITNVGLIKIIDNEEKIVYLEGGAENYLTVHTIYKKTGVSTYNKNVQILPGVPSMTGAMGTCVGY